MSSPAKEVQRAWYYVYVDLIVKVTFRVVYQCVTDFPCERICLVFIGICLAEAVLIWLSSVASDQARIVSVLR